MVLGHVDLNTDAMKPYPRKPLFKTSARKIGQQVAAIPLRRQAHGALEVLLVTSRGTGRWVAPKGWLMPGKENWEAARIEAFEEAGVEGTVLQKSIGSYHYWKASGDLGSWMRVETFAMAVTTMHQIWPEEKERERKWFGLDEAAAVIVEPELAGILEGFRQTDGSVGLPEELAAALASASVAIWPIRN